MSFTSVSRCAADESFAQRCRAAYAKEGVQTPDPAWYQNHWLIAADPSIEAAYASALAGGNPDPGGDESAITDAMITAAVQTYPYVPA